MAVNPIRKELGPPGYLHDKLDVPKDKKIPISKLKEAAKSDNKILAARAQLVLDLRKRNLQK